jgi:hypothetical protein
MIINFNETQTLKTNNLKVTIGALKFVSRNEAQISKANNLKVTIGALKFISRIIQ